MFHKIFIFLSLFIFSSLVSASSVRGTYYVKADVLKVRNGPSTNYIHSYSIYNNYKVRVFEIKDGWARISRYKTTTSNGKFVKAAKWTFAKYLTKSDAKTQIKSKKKKKSIKKSSKATKTKKVNNTALIEAISPSDNYDKHAPLFLSASKKLIEEKRCKIYDFKRMRGWVESTPINRYFTYCGGFRRTNKIYLDILTGEISK